MKNKRWQSIFSKTKNSTILFPGRFQPFHNVHLLLLKKMLENNKVIILIGSSDLVDENNPFTAKERVEMIKAVVADEKLDAGRVSFAFLPDEKDDEAWAEMVVGLKEKFDCVFSNNPRVLAQMKKHGFKTLSTGIVDENVSASTVRSLLSQGRGWKALVPSAVAKRVNAFSTLSDYTQ